MGHTLRPIPTPPETLHRTPDAQSYTLGDMFLIHDCGEEQHHLSVRIRRNNRAPTDAELTEAWEKVVGEGAFAVIPARGSMLAAHLFGAPKGGTVEEFLDELKEQGARLLAPDKED